jgi:folate-dependent phosphoribosylglycinamide formyltransferase PurN
MANKSLSNIVVLISGSGSNLQSIIDNADDIGVNIQSVISNKADAFGLQRAKQKCRVDVKNFASICRKCSNKISG